MKILSLIVGCAVICLLIICKLSFDFLFDSYKALSKGDGYKIPEKELEKTKKENDVCHTILLVIFIVLLSFIYND